MFMEFNLEELIELKFALNELKANRIVYKKYETNEQRLKNNDKYIKMDEKLVERVIKEIDKRTN